MLKFTGKVRENPLPAAHRAPVRPLAVEGVQTTFSTDWDGSRAAASVGKGSLCAVNLPIPLTEFGRPQGKDIAQNGPDFLVLQAAFPALHGGIAGGRAIFDNGKQNVRWVVPSVPIPIVRRGDISPVRLPAAIRLRGSFPYTGFPVAYRAVSPVQGLAQPDFARRAARYFHFQGGHPPGQHGEQGRRKPHQSPRQDPGRAAPSRPFFFFPWEAGSTRCRRTRNGQLKGRCSKAAARL